MSTMTTAVDPRVAVTFAKKQNTPTVWIEGEYPEDARPEALFAAFEEAGWSLDPVQESVPAFEPYDFDYSKPLGQQASGRGYRVREFALTRRGSGLFTGQTVEEARAFKAEARRVLRRFGFTRVPTWSKTLADLL